MHVQMAEVCSREFRTGIQLANGIYCNYPISGVTDIRALQLLRVLHEFWMRAGSEADCSHKYPC